MHKGNFSELLPTIQRSITAAHFIAIDTELSGIGAHKDLNAPSIEDRFVSISKIARTHAMLSIGLACFIALPAAPSSEQIDTAVVQPLHYTVLVFNIVSQTSSSSGNTNPQPRCCFVSKTMWSNPGRFASSSRTVSFPPPMRALTDALPVATLPWISKPYF